MVDDGVTVIDVPVPAGEPEVHEPEYHFQLETVPKLPPDKVNTEVPEHIAAGKDSAVIADTDSVFNSTFAVIQAVFPQVPSALT